MPLAGRFGRRLVRGDGDGICRHYGGDEIDNYSKTSD
jgi:hypothetical protein